MPININSQLITAISCEGREIVRAHAGLDLVWEKAGGMPEGFVDINGTIWATTYLNWTDGGAGIYILDTFATGELIGYYDRPAIERYLSANPQFRLPTASDFANLSSAYAINATVKYLVFPSSTYWFNNYDYNENRFGFKAIAAGWFQSNALKLVKRYAGYGYLTANSGWLGMAGHIYTSDTISVEAATTGRYMPVRLIYVP